MTGDASNESEGTRVENDCMEEEEGQEGETEFDDEELSPGTTQSPRRTRYRRDTYDSEEDFRRQSSDQHNENERKRYRNYLEDQTTSKKSSS